MEGQRSLIAFNERHESDGKIIWNNLVKEPIFFLKNRKEGGGYGKGKDGEILSGGRNQRSSRKCGLSRSSAGQHGFLEILLC